MSECAADGTPRWVVLRRTAMLCKTPVTRAVPLRLQDSPAPPLRRALVVSPYLCPLERGHGRAEGRFASPSRATLHEAAVRNGSGPSAADPTEQATV